MGGSKKNAKGRLDKYYHMAKEHGYRSRAAFKLIQLNKKYDFLTNAKVVVDLCAAPGGWLQVASKYMPMASIKIGVDLDPIKPIKGCVTFQCDITTPKCVALIKKELKHFQADVVMNDGAPNVGTDWNLDAYMQIELSLHAVKLATQVLKKGGTFVCKVFRSKDYNSFLYVLNSLFTKVESSKPPSSRSQSAEIFMVCIGYKAPDYIDPKFLDPKFAFEDIDNRMGGVDGNAKDLSGAGVMSIKKFLKEKRPNRSGYATDKTASMVHEVCDLTDFLESAEPFEFLTKFQQFNIDRKGTDLLTLAKVKQPADMADICNDIRVCGRSELNKLLTLRHKYQAYVKKQNVPEKQAEPELDAEAIIEKQLDEAILRIEKEKKRAAKKERELKVKQEYRQKMSVIATSTGIDNDEELNMNGRLWDELREKGFEHLEGDVSEVESSSQEDEEMEEESEQSDVDQKELRVMKMAQEMEDNIQAQKDYANTIDRKHAKGEIKRKQLLESQRQLRGEVSEDEEMRNRDLMSVESSDSEEPPEPLLELMDGKDIESEGHSSEEEAQFVNPLSKPKKFIDDKGEVSEGEWSDDDVEADKVKKAKKETKLGKRKRSDKDGETDVAKGFFGGDEIEEVPQEHNASDDNVSMDSDEIAETRILAKKMLRKKQRTELLDATYNRYSFHEDPASLPTWFVDDEGRNYYRRYNPTKEEIQAEKDEIKAYNARPSKKVEEAKARKKKRLVKAMQKIKTKAQVIADQDINEQTKMKQIQKMYSKEKAKHKEEKTYVVNRSFNAAKGGKVGRGTKLVDSRLKKDLFKQKKAKKSSKGAGKQKNGKGKGRK